MTMRRIAYVLICQSIIATSVWAQGTPQTELPTLPRSAAIERGLPSKLEVPDVAIEPITSHDVMRLSDTGIFNTIGSIIMDNKQYYGRAPIWVPLVKITLSNMVLWAIDRYVFDFPWSHI